jgi:hypothetical protein
MNDYPSGFTHREAGQHSIGLTGDRLDEDEGVKTMADNQCVWGFVVVAHGNSS